MVGGGVAVVVGCVLLTARPALVEASPAPVATLTLLFGALLVVGAWWPIPAVAPSSGPGRAARMSTTAAVAVGLGAFALGRVIGGGHAPAGLTIALVVTNTLAAVAEEAFFRRLCYVLLAPGGTAWAVVGSSVLFAVVHVTTYGLWVLPLDLAAGLVLGWQRAATGSWRAPAITHVVVNLLIVL
jgi:membrane protease YdiL (CAAX protease family)